MLEIVINETEYYDEEEQEFIVAEEITLQLEHSLASLSKWESILEKPFLTQDEKTDEEVFLYIKCMITNSEFPPGVVSRITQSDLNAISDYMNRKMTATWFNEIDPKAPRRNTETLTSELIYFWMTEFKIPFEAENWHLNRLFTLIKIANLKNQKPKKMSRAEIASRNRALNEKRRAQMGSKG